MSVCALDFHESAKLLAQNSDEMSKRNAVSRAYYAAYHYVQSVFPEQRAAWDPQIKGMHKQYCAQLMQGTSIQRKIGTKLQAMHTRRIDADYICKVDLCKSHLAMQMATAEDVFSLIDSLQAPPAAASS